VYQWLLDQREAGRLELMSPWIQDQLLACLGYGRHASDHYRLWLCCKCTECTHGLNVNLVKNCLFYIYNQQTTFSFSDNNVSPKVNAIVPFTTANLSVIVL